MTYRALVLVSFLSAATSLAVACSDPSESDAGNGQQGGDTHSHDQLPPVDCDAGTIPTYSELAIIDNCTSCHSSTLSGNARLEAPENINYDTYAAAVAEAEHAAIVVYAGAMPPDNLGNPSDADKQALYKWALCGTPQ